MESGIVIRRHIRPGPRTLHEICGLVVKHLQTSYKNSSGFTLLEVLVVLLVIGVMATMGLLSLGRSDADAVINVEARRVSAIIQLARQEAILNARYLGLSFSELGYKFYKLGDEGWRLITDDNDLRQRKFTNGVKSSFEEPLVLTTANQASGEGENDLEPQIIFYSSGEMTPFKVYLFIDATGNAYNIEGNFNGTAEIYSPDAT